jgi:transcriptional regulator with XRE-family HTH domain
MAVPRSELAALLRSRRERLQPADVGLPPGSRRRTAGLRREEVALLAAISPTYYTFLEQGRDVRPSRQVLDALAGALRLSPTERAYLHELAGGEAVNAAPEILADGVAELVQRLDPAPTYVTGRRFDVLAANPAARELFADWPPGTNLLRWMLCSAEAREVYGEWEREASAQLGRFRAAAARHPDDAGFAELVEELLRDSAEMRAWWPRVDVAPLGGGEKRLRGRRYRHVVLQVAEDPEQKLVTFAAPP